MNNTLKIGACTALLALAVVAFAPSASAMAEVSYTNVGGTANPVYHCSYSGGGTYSCQGVVGACYVEWTDNDPDPNPYDPGATITYITCV